jgi:hypothetical protein
MLKGLIDCADLDGSLPNPILTRAALVGRFYHRVMELAVVTRDEVELEALIETEIKLVQSEAIKWPHLRRAGTVSGWDEVNAAAAHAMRLCKAGKNAGSLATLRRVEHTLRSQDGLLIGKPDRYTIVASNAFLEEYKSGAIRDDLGIAKARFLDQLRFYAVLIFDNHEVETVTGSIQSLTGDTFNTTLERADSIEFASRLATYVEDVNSRVRAGQTPSEFANTSGNACTYCSAHSICQRFKEEQDRIELEGEQYLCEGTAIDLISGGGEGVSRLTISDEYRKVSIPISLPAGVGSGIEPKRKYQLLNLRRRGSSLEWGFTSRILRFD